MSAQITPLYNPKGNTYIVINGDFNAESYSNGGTLEVQGPVSFSNSGEIYNQETARINNFGSFDIESGGLINNESKSYFNSTGTLTSEGSFNNYGEMSASGFSNNEGAVLNNYSGGTVQAGTDNGVINFGSATNKGTITNYGIINISGELVNDGSGSINGTGQINGEVFSPGDFSPGASAAGGFLVNGFLTLSQGSTKFIELAGDYDANRDRLNTEHDFIDVAGDLTINGCTLDVSLIDGFELDLGQLFIISKVDGELTGTYEGLEEGAVVGSFDSVYGQNGMNLFISYKAGDGNDIGLYSTNSSLAPSPSDSVDRLYNSSEGRHLLSSNENEIDILTERGWVNEGTIYSAPEQATAEVFRFYIASENRHFYTALESERDIIIGDQATFSDWEYEGGAFSAYSTNDFPSDAVAVVRYLNQVSGNHVYSTSVFEQGILDQDSNWVNEGIAWYGNALPTTNDFV